MRVKLTRIPVMLAVRDRAGLARKPYFDGGRLLALTASEDATKPASLTRQPRSPPPLVRQEASGRGVEKRKV